MAIVCNKKRHDENYIEIKVDLSNKDYINQKCCSVSYHTMYVYFFDSMSTRLREFRTIKCLEFYRHAKYILNP